MTDTTNDNLTHIDDFPHREMSSDDVRELHERRKLDDDEAFIAGKKWARSEDLDSPQVFNDDTHQEYIELYSKIGDEARQRYPDDVVAQSRFSEGAKAWAGA